MISIILIWIAFLLACWFGLSRPWLGVIYYYGWVVLEPQWNWFWSIPRGFQFQKYIAMALIAGTIFSGINTASLTKNGRKAVISLLLFLGISFISKMQSISPELSEFYLSIIWKIIIIAVIASITLNSPKKIWLCLAVCGIAQGYSAYRINLEYFELGYCRYAFQKWGSMGDNNLYSNLTIPMLAICLSLGFCSRDKRLKLLFLTIAVLQTHQIFLMQSRGAMLGMIATYILVILMYPRSTANNTLVLVSAAFIAALAGPPVVKEFSSIFAAEEERDSSAQSRIYLWNAGAKITMDYPLLGAGPYAGQALVPAYYPGMTQGVNKGLHNLFFEVSTGVGILGALLYINFFFAPMWRAIRAGKQKHNPELESIRIAAVCGTAGYFAASMFSSGALAESSYILAACGIAAMSFYSKVPKPIASTTEFQQTVTQA